MELEGSEFLFSQTVKRQGKSFFTVHTCACTCVRERKEEEGGKVKWGGRSKGGRGGVVGGGRGGEVGEWEEG